MQNQLTAEDVNQWIEDDTCEVFLDEDEDEEINELLENDIPADEGVKIKHCDVIKSFDVCIQWGQENNIDISKTLILRELQEQAIEKSLKKTQKQTSITSFFK